MSLHQHDIELRKEDIELTKEGNMIRGQQMENEYKLRKEQLKIDKMSTENQRKQLDMLMTLSNQINRIELN